MWVLREEGAFKVREHVCVDGVGGLWVDGVFIKKLNESEKQSVNNIIATQVKYEHEHRYEGLINLKWLEKKEE